MVHPRSSTRTIILRIALLFLHLNVTSVDAFPGAAGHCKSGDLSGKGSGHGENGGGPISNGQLRVKFDSTSLQTFSKAILNANQVYTVTLDFSTSNSAFFYRGFLFRLSGKNGENVEGSFSRGSDSNAQIKSGCDSGISAMTHTGRTDKTSVSFDFEYTGSTDADLILEVTVVRERAADNWFYSLFQIQIGDGGSVITPAPTPSPTALFSSSPSQSAVTTASPTRSAVTTESPTTSSTTSSCVDSPVRFRTTNPKTGSYIWRDCVWVASKSTNQRCTWDDVSSMCPKTCKICSSSGSSCTDATGRFRVLLNGKKIARDCEWVGNRSTNFRCAAFGVAVTCPVTCKNC